MSSVILQYLACSMGKLYLHFKFSISLGIYHSLVIILTLGIWRWYTKLTKHMWKEGSEFHVKCSLNPQGEGINDVFAKRKLLRQISVNVSVLEIQRARRSCKVISISIPSTAERMWGLQNITFLSKKSKGQQKLERKQHTLRCSFRWAKASLEIIPVFCSDLRFPFNWLRY